MAQKHQKIAKSNLFSFRFYVFIISYFFCFLFLELFLNKPAMVLRYITHVKGVWQKLDAHRFVVDSSQVGLPGLI